MSENHKNEACKTYLEQTKLLVTLSSVFILAPAVLIEQINIFHSLSILMEIFFIVSVFFGYVVYGTISGTQHKNEFNVYNKGTTIFSWAQILTFITGLSLLIYNLKETEMKPEDKKPPLVEKIKPLYIKDQIIRINNVYFDYNKWGLRPESYGELNKVVDTLKKYSNLEIEISAHTDSHGSDLCNLILSQKRATSVLQYIVTHGVLTSQVRSMGYGETIPAMSNDTYEGRQFNRRIEFKVLKNY